MCQLSGQDITVIKKTNLLCTLNNFLEKFKVRKVTHTTKHDILDFKDYLLQD